MKINMLDSSVNSKSKGNNTIHIIQSPDLAKQTIRENWKTRIKNQTPRENILCCLLWAKERNIMWGSLSLNISNEN